MAATVVQSKSGAQNTGLATVAATWNTATTAGNVLVLVVAADDYASTPPADWTESAGCRQETFLGHYVWWKKATGGETSVNYTIGSASPSLWLTAEIGGLTATPFDTSSGTFAQSSGTTFTTNALTPSAGERLLLASIGGSFAGTLAGVDTWQNSFAEIVDAFTTLASGTRDTAGIAQRAVTADGTTSYSTGATYTGATVQSRTGIILAFKVAAAGGTTIAGAAAFTAGTTLAATATTKGNIAGAAGLTAQTTATAAARGDVRAAAQTAGGGGLAAAGTVAARSSADLNATTSLTATATTSTPTAPQVSASAALAAAGTTTATGHADSRATATLTAAGQATTTVTLSHYCAATLTATGTLTAHWTSGQTGDITLTVGTPARAWATHHPATTWATGTPEHTWKAGPPTL